MNISQWIIQDQHYVTLSGFRDGGPDEITAPLKGSEDVQSTASAIVGYCQDYDIEQMVAHIPLDNNKYLRLQYILEQEAMFVCKVSHTRQYVCKTNMIRL